MAFKDLREFMAACQADVIEVNRYVNLDLEMGKALRKNYAHKSSIIVFHENGTEYPVVAGIFGNRERALKAFNATNETINDIFINGLNKPIAPVLVQNAPCQEVVITGEDIDITKLPIPKFADTDGGPYLTAGITVSRDPETGATDVGHFRFQVHDKNHFGYFAQPFHRFGKNVLKAKAQGKDRLEAAIVIGTEPVLGYTCQIKQVADDTDDFYLCGGLRGEAVELVKCKTIDLEVPATAEFVIEIEVIFDEMQNRMEGPLGEYTGYMTPASPKHVCRVKAITHRKNPYFQVLLTGKPVTENHILKNIPFEASFMNAIKKQYPTVKDVAITPSGGVQLYMAISMAQRYAGEARSLILNAMSSNVRPKWIIVTDPDIDVHNSAEVEWAMAFRTNPAKDLIIVGGVPSAPLDPSSTNGELLALRTNDTVGVDATLPFGDKEFPEVADVKGWKDYDFPELVGK